MKTTYIYDLAVKVLDKAPPVIHPGELAKRLRDALEDIDGILFSETKVVQVHKPAPAEDKPTALAVQVGGQHYKGMKIQHVEYVQANNIPYIEGNAIKYISRHRSKNGAEDIKKAIHYLQILLELEYGKPTEAPPTPPS